MIALSTPRRWSDAADGIRWLPRMIDKARMASSGALGAYLFGHSPIDRALLTRLGVTTDEFAAIVAASPAITHLSFTLRRAPMD